MPIYEYHCDDCKRRVSLFFRSFSAAETGLPEARCPNCGSAKLSRLVSKVAFLRGSNPQSTGHELDYSSDYSSEADDWAGEGVGGMPGLDSLMNGVDEDDPRSVARWARQMQSQTGEDLGPEFNTALSRIESGENPDNVLEDLDPAIGMGGDMDGDDAFDE